jgi:hypothetical protein
VRGEVRGEMRGEGCGAGWGAPSTSSTMRAPWMGGLLYMGRMTSLSCDSRRAASSALAHTIESRPTRSP